MSLSHNSRSRMGLIACYLVSLVILLAIYQASLSQPPRADEFIVLYLFQMYVGALDTVVHAYSFSRSYSHADLHAFRPIKNILMIFEWIAFGYKFWGYQLMGIVLHSVVVTQLFFILRNVLKTAVVFAIGLTFWFACFPMVGEAVTWQNVHGPILYSIFVLAGLKIWWAAESKRRSNPWSYLCFLLAALTEDEGAAALILAFYCCLVGLLEYRHSRSKEVLSFYLKNGAVFLATVFVVMALSYVDLRFNGYSLHDLFRSMGSHAGLLQLIEYPFLVARFWLDAFFIPAAYRFEGGGRMEIGSSDSFGIWYWLNLCAVAVILANAAMAAFLQLKRPDKDALRMGALLVMLALGFAALFSMGRAAERGLQFALGNGLYVAYPFSVFVVLLLGLLLRPEAIGRLRLFAAGAIIISIASIGLMQLYSLLSVDDRMQEYFANDNAVYMSVLSSAAAAPNPYTFTFSFKEPCRTNRALSWFDNKTIAEVTFPRWYRAKGGEVTLQCPVADPGVPIAVTPSFIGDYNVEFAFDRSVAVDSFVETNFPTTVQVELASRALVTGYSLFTGEAAQRMPLHWRVYAIDKAGNRTLIDDRKTGVWKPYESRRFELVAPKDAKRLAFGFLEGKSKLLRIYDIRIHAR